MKAINCIELAHSYYLLSNDHVGKPILIGNRIKLEFALQGIKADMIIATSGNDKRCVVLVDFTTEEVIHLAEKATNKVLRLKTLN